MKAVEIRNLSEKELSEKLVDLKVSFSTFASSTQLTSLRIRRELRLSKKTLPEFPRLSRKMQ